MRNIRHWIDGLGMTQHPEGGYFKENYRHDRVIPGGTPGESGDGGRNLATSIYFLLPSEDMSRFHRLKSDELWYFHDGAPLTLFIIDSRGTLTELMLGLDLEKGEQPQVVIPAGSIFGAEVSRPGAYTLMGCMVAPGFDFRDFALMSREDLLAAYPRHEKVILRLT